MPAFGLFVGSRHHDAPSSEIFVFFDLLYQSIFTEWSILAVIDKFQGGKKGRWVTNVFSHILYFPFTKGSREVIVVKERYFFLN